tara:strand:+ start:812 stop:1180 length:369 start_codon:yes stop_codon:yes gene_type:complete
MLKEIAASSMSIKIQAVAFKLEVPQKTSHNISMMNITNREGFKEAMKEGTPWTTLDCQISQTKNGRWYWEIEKHVFFEKEGRCERLGEGEDDDSLKMVKKIWENFIEKYQPDEYFVDQDITE